MRESQNVLNDVTDFPIGFWVILVASVCSQPAATHAHNEVNLMSPMTPQVYKKFNLHNRSGE